MFKKMNLVTKLLIGFSIPLLIIVGIVLDVYGVTKGIKENVKLVGAQNTESFAFAILAQNMQLNVVEVQQFLTDVSATRGQNGLDSGFEEAEKSRQAFLAGLSRFREMYKSKNSLDDLKRLDQIERSFAGYYQNGKKMAKAYVTGGPAEGNKQMGDFDKATDALSEAMGKFVASQTLQGQSALSSIPSYLDKLVRNISIFAMLGFVFSVIVAWCSTRSISRSLRSIIRGLWESADKVSTASGQVSSASQELAEGASEQAASIEETSSSLEEMASMTRQNATNGNMANNLMDKTKQIVAQANGSMGRLTISMGEISKASEETSRIIKTIDEIAFQTNLLALNAAVEAARAGDAGAGFAVVADEVRNLAMRAADAAKNTANLIEDTVKKINEGSEMVKNTNAEFSQVEISAGKMGELIGEISAASGEQAQGIEQISKAVSEMDKVVQQNSANAEETAGASEEMNAQAAQLKGFVGDLVALVGGANASRTRNSAHSFQKEVKVAKSSENFSVQSVVQEERVTNRSKNGNGKDLAYSGKRNAEQVIPFDAEDSDF
jgi:methyl-accepting chemotaxis protein